MFIYRRGIRASVVVCACGVVVAFSSRVALAERYESTMLGPAAVSYVEHRNSINDAGDIAWTTLDPSDANRPKARLTRTGGSGAPMVDLHALRPTSTDISSRAEDINEQGDIVGYSTDGMREVRRHAIAWIRRSTAPGSLTALDLHTPAQTGGGTFEQTAAYGVSERVGNVVYVAGYRRASVTDSSNKGFSKPILWKIDVSDPAAPVVTTVIALSGAEGPNQYGIAYDVAVDSAGRVVAVGAMGGQNPASGSPTGPAYQFAYRWRSDVGPWSAAAITDTGASAYATSAATRIIADDERVWTTGYALTTAGESRAFLNEYVTGSGSQPSTPTQAGGKLDAGSISTGLGLVLRTQPTAFSERPIVVGGAATASRGPVFESSPASYAFHGMYAFDVASPTQVCDVEYDRSISASTAQALSDMNARGAAVGIAGTDAVFLAPVPKEAPSVTRYIRTPSNEGVADYWWLEVPTSSGDAGQHGEIVFSDSPGCALASGCGAGTLDLDDSSADIVSFSGVRAIGGQYSAFSGRQMGQAPTLKRYAQYSIANPSKTGDFACDVSDIVETSPVMDVINACSDATPEPSVAGFGGEWRDCIASGGRNAGCETDVRTSKDHCGQCNRSVDDGFSCTTDACVAGEVSNAINAGACLISDGCYVSQDRAPGPYGGHNPCSACLPNLSQTSWSHTGSAACCSSGNAKLDSYDTSGGGTGPDKNRGDSAVSVSTLATMRDDNGWSVKDRECVRSWIFGCREWRDLPLACHGDVSTGTARFNPDVDTRDWYKFFAEDNVGFAGVDANGNPEPRARVILQDNFTARVCMYVTCRRGDNNGELNPRRTTGTAWTAEANAPSGTPAAGGKGRCTTVSGVGAIADLEAKTAACDGSNIWNTDNEGWLMVSVEAMSASHLECTATNYKIRWGNDRQTGHYDHADGCLNCCN